MATVWLMIGTWLPEGDDVLTNPPVRVPSSGGQCDGLNTTFFLSFVLSFSVSLTGSVLMELMQILQQQTFASRVWLSHFSMDYSSLHDVVRASTA